MVDAGTRDMTNLQGWWLDVVGIHLAEARHVADPVKSSLMTAEGARIVLDELSDSPRALGLIEDALAFDEGCLPALRLAYRLPLGLIEPTREIELLRALVECSPDPSEQVGAAWRLVERSAERGEVADAFSYVGLILDIEPSNAAALTRCSQLGASLGEDGQTEVYRRRIAAETSPEGEARLWCKLAGHYEHALNRADLALHAYGEAHALAPDNSEAAHGLYRLRHRAGDVEGARAVQGLPLALDGLGLADLGQAGGIVAPSCYGEHESLVWMRHSLEALQRDHEGDNLGALKSCRVLAETGALPRAAGLMWQRAAQVVGDDQQLLASLEHLLDLLPTDQRKCALLLRTGRRLEWILDESDKAWACYSRISELHGRSEDAAAIEQTGFYGDYLRLAGERMEVEEFVQAAHGLLDSAVLTATRATILDAIACVTARRTEAGGQASVLERLLAHEPENLFAHRFLEIDHRRRRAWLGLVQRLTAELPHVGQIRQIEIYDEIAQTQLRLGAPREAEDAWREALALDGAWYPAHVGLGQLLDAQGRWADLADLLSNQLAEMEADDPGRAGLMGRLAELYEFHLQHHLDAAGVYGEILVIRPGAPDAIAGLRRTLIHIGAHERLAQALELFVGQTGQMSGGRAAQVWLQIGDIYARNLDASEAAKECYERALEAKPNWPPAMLSLEWLLAKTGRTDASIRHLASGLIEDGAGQPVRLAKLALLTEPSVAASYWRTLETSDQNADFAAFSLLRLRAEAQDDQGLAAGLAAFSSRLVEPTETAMLLKEAAERGEAHLDLSQRLALWQRIIELAPMDERAWQAIGSLLSYGDVDEARLAHFLRSESFYRDVDSLTTGMWLRGYSLERQVGRDAALMDYRRAADSSSNDVIPQWLLAQGEEGEDPNQINRLELLAESVADPAVASDALKRAARAWLTERMDPESCLRCARAAIDLQPNDVIAADLAEQALASLGRQDDIIQLNEDRLVRITDSDVRADCLFHLARLYDRVARDPVKARAALEEGLAIEPSNESAQLALASFMLNDNENTQTEERLVHLTNTSDDEAVLAQAYSRLAEARKALGSPAAVIISDLERAAQLEEGADAYLALGDAYLDNKQYELARMTFREMAKVSTDEPARLLSVLCQVEALVWAGRASEGARLFARHGRDDALDYRCVDRATRLLTNRQALPGDLRARLTELVNASAQVVTEAQPVPTAAELSALEVSEAQGPSKQKAAGTVASAADVLSPYRPEKSDTDGPGSGPALGEGVDELSLNSEWQSKVPDFEPESASFREGESVLDAGHWTNLAQQAAPGSVSENWYAGIAAWFNGEMAPAPLHFFRGVLSEDLLGRVVPAGLPVPVALLLRRMLGGVGQPLASDIELAEIAAEGWSFTSDFEAFRSVNDFGESLELKDVHLVQNSSRPYTVDVLRKASPVVSIGAELLMAIGPQRASFLMASSLVPLAYGLPLPGHTMEGREFNEAALEALLDALYEELGDPLAARLDDGPLVYSRLVHMLRVELGDAGWSAVGHAAEAARAPLMDASMASLRRGLDVLAARLALVYCDGFGAAVDMLRQLDYDDRPRLALTVDERRRLLTENPIIKDLWGFAQSDVCLEAREALARRR